MTGDDVAGAARAERAPGAGSSTARPPSRARSTRRPRSSGAAWRREEGWAARWWEDGGAALRGGDEPGRARPRRSPTPRACPSRPDEPPPAWPANDSGGRRRGAVEAPPELFEELLRAARGRLARRGRARGAWRVRRGRAEERIVNAGGPRRRAGRDRVSTASRRSWRGGRAGRARSASPFRWDVGARTSTTLARRLADAATLPLSDRPRRSSRGQWLLDPAVGAALLAAIAPLFSAERPPRWIAREKLAAPAVVDRGRRVAPTRPSTARASRRRRMLLVEDGRARREAARPALGAARGRALDGPRRAPLVPHAAALRPAAALLRDRTPVAPRGAARRRHDAGSSPRP